MHKGKARIRFHIQPASRNPYEGFFGGNGCWIQASAGLETTKGTQSCTCLLCLCESQAPLVECGKYFER